MNEGDRTPWTVRVLLAVAALLFSLAAAEVALRTLAPLPDPYAWNKTRRWAIPSYVPSSFPPNVSRTFEPEEGLPGMTSELKTFSTNNYGFRGDSLAMPSPDDEHRIFLVGGSTFECLYLDDSESIGRLLQEELMVRAENGVRHRVYNAGKSGTRTYDYLALLVHRIVHLDPDLVVVFPGFNDFLQARSGRSYVLPNDRATSEGARMTYKQLVLYLATELQLGRYAVGALGLAAEDQETITHRSDYASLAEKARSRPLADTAPPVELEPYARNLASLAGVARSHDFDLVFMTQPVTWGSDASPTIERWHWMTRVGSEGVRYPEDELREAMDRYNATTEEVARRHGVPVLRLDEEMELSARNFYDDVHFNERGAEVAARILAAFLRAEGVVRDGSR